MNLYSTFCRQYDPQLGRFNGVDILSEQQAVYSPYHFAGGNPIMYNDPLGDKLDVVNSNSQAFIQFWNDLVSYVSSGASIVDMWQNGTEFDAFTWSNTEGGGEVAFGWNSTATNEAGFFSESVEGVVRQLILGNNHSAAVNKILTSYPDSFLPGPGRSMFLWNNPYHKVFTTFNSEVGRGANTFEINWSIPILNDWANGKGGSFGYLVRSMYHEYVHIYNATPNSGFDYFDSKTDINETEFYAYFYMYQDKNLPGATQNEIRQDYQNAFAAFQLMPADRQGQSGYAVMILVMMYYNSHGHTSIGVK